MKNFIGETFMFNDDSQGENEKKNGGGVGRRKII